MIVFDWLLLGILREKKPAGFGQDVAREQDDEID